MAFAANNQRFKDAVNEFAHCLLLANLIAGGTASDMQSNQCPDDEKGIIRRVWNRCMTESDYDELETGITEIDINSQLLYDSRVTQYFEDDFEAEMKEQIQQLINDQ